MKQKGASKGRLNKSTNKTNYSNVHERTNPHERVLDRDDEQHIDRLSIRCVERAVSDLINGERIHNSVTPSDWLRDRAESKCSGVYSDLSLNTRLVVLQTTACEVGVSNSGAAEQGGV